MLTLLLVDQEVHVGVDGDDDQIGRKVSSTDHHQDIRILEGDLLRNLHHHKDDYQVGTGAPGQ
jgi:hypothetical protein